jgi:hypothetical protein
MKDAATNQIHHGMRAEGMLSCLCYSGDAHYRHTDRRIGKKGGCPVSRKALELCNSAIWCSLVREPSKHTNGRDCRLASNSAGPTSQPLHSGASARRGWENLHKRRKGKIFKVNPEFASLIVLRSGLSPTYAPLVISEQF